MMKSADSINLATLRERDFVGYPQLLIEFVAILLFFACSPLGVYEHTTGNKRDL
jgi:hypothetical protein